MSITRQYHLTTPFKIDKTLITFYFPIKFYRDLKRVKENQSINHEQ